MLKVQLALALVLAAAHVGVAACDKNCGSGSYIESGWRHGCESGSPECYWVRCSGHVGGCGYTEDINDVCGGPGYCWN